MGLGTAFFPVVGALIGAILYGASWMLDLAFPDIVRAVLILALWILLTGGLHVDGFLDACDGLLGGYTAESRLEIMRDERIGSFAFTGGVLLLLLFFSAAYELPVLTPAWLLAPILGRWGMTLVIVAFPYARSTGLGSDMKANASWVQVLVASLFSIPFVLLIGGFAGAVALLVSLLVTGCTVWFSLRRIPGLTGDIYGAICLLVEASTLLVFTLQVWQ